MDTEGKTKDSYKTRLDMQEMVIKPDLHHVCVDGVIKFGPAYYTFNKEERKWFCEFCDCLKLPDGMASSISNCVNIADSKIYELKKKSLDCHIILQWLLPVALRGYLSKKVRDVIIRLCWFFKELTSKTLRLDVLEKLDKDIAILLCNLELNFPPSFFNIMTHLPQEAILARPVQFRWMFPFERKMHDFKDFCGNKAHPEGSIEAYCDSECLQFCSIYFRDMETKFNRDRNRDVSERRAKGLSVFNQNVRFLKGAVDDVLSLTGFALIRWYVLNNCDEVCSLIAPQRQPKRSETSFLNVGLLNGLNSNQSSYLKQNHCPMSLLRNDDRLKQVMRGGAEAVINELRLASDPVEQAP